MKKADFEINALDRSYLRKFFIDNYDWFINHLNPTKDDIIELISILESFMAKEILLSNRVFAIFLQDLINEVEDFKEPRYRKFVIRTANPKQDLKYIQNSTLAKWRLEARLERYDFTPKEESHGVIRKRGQ